MLKWIMDMWRLFGLFSLLLCMLFFFLIHHKNIRKATFSIWASLVAQMVKNLPSMQETRVWSLGQEDQLEMGIATHFSTLAWRIPWTEEPGGLQSVGLQRARHDWATNTLIQYLSWEKSFFLESCLGRRGEEKMGCRGCLEKLPKKHNHVQYSSSVWTGHF